MNKIKSLDDLKRVREEALEKRSKTTVTGKAHVIVGMGTCGIAAGARETMKAVLDFIEAEKMEGILVTQTGCIGLCEQEPILQVARGEEEMITYGKVNPDVAKRILKEHVADGKIVKEFVVNL
jgi:NADP-reducing hydrogenase subunit HndB